MNGNNNGFVFNNGATSNKINTVNILNKNQKIQVENDRIVSLNLTQPYEVSSYSNINKFQSNNNFKNQIPFSNNVHVKNLKFVKSPLNNSNITKKTLIDSEKTSLNLDLNQKLELTNKLLNNSNLAFNCIQLINFLDFYFGYDEQVPNDDSEDLENGSELKNELNRVNSSYNHSSLNDKNLLSVAYPCIACSIKYKYDQTFHLHLNRRSVMIRIYCIKCDTFKTFYNTCKLMYHIYSHKMNLFEPMFKSIKIESLTIEKFTSYKEKNIDIDLILSSKLSQPAPWTSLKQSKPFQISTNESIQIKVFLKRILLNKFMLYKCCICDALFFDLRDLKQHFLKSQRLDSNLLPPTKNVQSLNDSLDINNEDGNYKISNRISFKNLKQKYFESLNKNQFSKLLNLTSNNSNSLKDPNLQNSDLIVKLLNNFSIKKLQYTTRCSMIALSNLIDLNFSLYNDKNKITNNKQTLNKSNILICPECGLTFDSIDELENFRLHLIHECFFTAKYDYTQIRCPADSCFQLFDSLHDAVTHWSNNHMIKQHQCDLCDKQGLIYTFEESQMMGVQSSNGNEKNNILNQIISKDLDDLSKNTGIHHSYNAISQVTPNNFQNNSSGSNSNNKRNEPILSQAIITDINRHYFEKHRNQQVSLKLNFRCLCQSLTKLHELNNEHKFDHNKDECLFYEWNSCRKHIIALLAKTISSLNCLICNKLVYNDKYKAHLKSVHNIEKICVCPKCGPLKDETSLHNHLLKLHNKDQNQNINMSSYFKVLGNSTENSKQNGISSSYQLLNDFSIYQCVNCRLLFTSKSNFSHNCWNQPTNDENQNNSPSVNTNNYFSPIFIKFNVNTLFEERLALIRASNVNNLSRCGKNRLSNDEQNSHDNRSSNESINCKKIKSSDRSFSETDIN